MVCQLAALSGAAIFAVSRRPSLLLQLQADGVEPAGVFTAIEQAKAAGTYDVILDSVGGDTLAIALAALAPDGICVNFGNSSRQPTTFNVRSAEWPFHRKQCIWMGREVPPDCTPVFTRLAELVKQGRLRVPVDKELPWTSIAEAAELLVQQQVNGKIVCTVM
jgi:NADPH:quinone reductase-like Zn-dependent oxidoreductase